jgi:hypothetical protein
MTRLGGAIANVIIEEYGADELLHRLSDSNWFQSLSCAIGYDWHSSGTTTVTMGALKEALKGDPDIVIAGGKGKAGINTPGDIVAGSDRLSIPSESEKFVELSRLSAKVDASMVYDNIGIYHHSFMFTKSRKWGVVQQAMNNSTGMALRFQWFSETLDHEDITNEPHSGISGTGGLQTVDLTYAANSWVKPASIELLPDIAEGRIKYPKRHAIMPREDLTEHGINMLKAANEMGPRDYREFLLIKGVGRATIRSLAIISSLIYEKELAGRDPVAYAYNLGGKDKIPYEINRRTYDSVIEEMEHMVDMSNVSMEEKYRSLRSLGRLMSKAATKQV